MSDGNPGPADSGLLASGLFEEQIRKRGDIWRRVEPICKAAFDGGTEAPSPDGGVGTTGFARLISRGAEPQQLGLIAFQTGQTLWMAGNLINIGILIDELSEGTMAHVRGEAFSPRNVSS